MGEIFQAFICFNLDDYRLQLTKTMEQRCETVNVCLTMIVREYAYSVIGQSVEYVKCRPTGVEMQSINHITRDITLLSIAIGY